MASRALDLIAEGIRLLAAEDAHALSDEVLLRSTEAILTHVDRLDGIAARRMQAMDSREVTVGECGRHVRSWLVEDRRRSEVEATRRTVIAKALPYYPVLEEALVAGEISLEHSARIVSLLRGSPAVLREVIEKELVEAARHCDPTRLGAFCRELKSRLGGAESAAERDERQYADRWVRLTRTFDGMHRLDGMLDPTSSALVESALRGLAPCTRGEEDFRSRGQRNADALVAMAQFSLTHEAGTDSAGEAANVMILAPLDTVRGELEAHRLAMTGSINGEPVSAATIRMLACDAGIIPAVLGSQGEVLDLGRKTSTWSVAQRRALKIESGGHCGWHRCHAPVGHAQAHHIEWWARDHGRTSIRNGVYLCHFHHRLIHTGKWQIAKDQHGKIRVWRT
ncbi:MAG TPA: DUF222 domain-containing protein [Mycobacteriales bacterium]|nr:DUF222 domain-containing protein [Mycobacteriales bacterium]